MSKPAFWPGFSWRILAHKRPKKHEPWSAESLDVRAGMEDTTYGDTRLMLSGNWEFDELVIDNWFHLEQMSARQWWLGVGNGDDYWHLNISVDGKGQARVSMEKQPAW